MALQAKIKKKFSGFTLDVEFETKEGCMGILGASGCGKSMTLKCIAGIEKPDSGRIVLNGRVLFDSEKKINLPVQERNVGYLFQNYALFPTMTVEQNLMVAMDGKKEEKRAKIKEQLERFELSGLEKRYPSQLSGGQQQRVALARMLLHQPEIIMLDEPFSALDGFLKDTLQLEMLELIEEYQKDVLMVSHSRDEIYRFCNNMVLLEKGSCILKGKTTDIFANPRKMEAARLTGCKNISVAEKRSSHSVYAKDWDFVFETEEEVKDSVKYIGIRAHYMKPSDVPEEVNSMKIVPAGYTETPFENQHLFKNAENPKSRRLWYIEEKPDLKETTEQPLPSYMIFPKKSLMLLE